MLVKQVSYQTLREWQNSGKAFRLMDLREKYERKTYHIGGEWMPLDDFIKEAGNLDNLQPIVLYCEKGIRSQIAIQRIQPRFPTLQLYNLSDGIAKFFKTDKQRY